ncbi:MAG TPA: carotenoid oxygenase family protein [Acidimicrobiales bacterium]|nr:carotenoid oxygenase family protein [Acidimicrobiales bacterium]
MSTTEQEAAEQEATPFWLSGNYAPVFDEITAFDLPVTGEIPADLRGLYVRNGSNPRSGWSRHWFFGNGMLHGVRIEDGKAVWYRNRYVRTPRYELDVDPNHVRNLGDRTMSAANTHVVAHAGRIFALEEASFPFEVDDELETIGCETWDGRLTTPFTAHPKLCPLTGELHFFGYGPFPPYLTYHVLDSSGVLVKSEPITVPGPTMMHDFMITSEHAIFMDLPVVIDLELAMRGESPLRWSDDYGARIGVMPRGGSDADVRWFEVEPCYVFHPSNAWTDGTKVVCDVGRHAWMWRTGMDDFAPAVLHRWTFDLKSGAVREERLDDRSHAFPRVADDKLGLHNRYAYMVQPRAGSDDAVTSPGMITKWDNAVDAATWHDLGPDAFPDEPVFVRTGDSAEDDGVVLSFVYDRSRDASDLVVLDATDMASDPVAVVHMPRRIPHGFHGSWIGD